MVIIYLLAWIIPGIISFKLNKYIYSIDNDITPAPFAWIIPIVNIIIVLALIAIYFISTNIFKEKYWIDKWKS